MIWQLLEYRQALTSNTILMDATMNSKKIKFFTALDSTISFHLEAFELSSFLTVRLPVWGIHQNDPNFRERRIN